MCEKLHAMERLDSYAGERGVGQMRSDAQKSASNKRVPLRNGVNETAGLKSSVKSRYGKIAQSASSTAYR